MNNFKQSMPNLRRSKASIVKLKTKIKRLNKPKKLLKRKMNRLNFFKVKLLFLQKLLKLKLKQQLELHISINLSILSQLRKLDLSLEMEQVARN